MGYTTTYKISIIASNSGIEIEDVIDRLNEISQYTFSQSGYLADFTWYAHEEHMQQLATEFPDTTFMLEGQGDDFEDRWRKFFHGEKFERVDLQWPTPPAFKRQDKRNIRIGIQAYECQWCGWHGQVGESIEKDHVDTCPKCSSSDLQLLEL